MTRWFVTACLFAVILYITGVSAETARTLPVAPFTVPPQFTDAALSPDGRYLATLKWGPNRYLLIVKDLDSKTGDPVDAIDPGPGQTLLWVDWTSARRLILAVGAYVIEDGVQNLITRLLAVDADGRNLVTLFDPDGRSGAARQDRVINFLPDDPQHILLSVADSDPNWPSVYRVNVETGKAQLVQKARPSIIYWMSDRAGKIRLGGGVANGTFKLIARPDASTGWHTIWEKPLTGSDEFSPVAFLDDPNLLIVRSNHEGGPTNLYRYDLSADRFTETLYSHGQVDIARVQLGAQRRRLIAVSYVLNDTQTVYLDKQVREDMDFVEGALPDKELEIISLSADGERYVIAARAPTDPGRYYIYDRAERTLTEFGTLNPLLDQDVLAPMTAYTYAARDGLEIPAFLTVPKGLKRGQHDPLPTVIFPHGGPLHRDRLQYSYVVQFLANRGYAVFQMNFRGSSGYGSTFQDLGYGEWGEAMQDDITDGVQWLIAEGISDPNRICILGGSYGGYAALMGAVKTPDLYACAISLNGVSDLRSFGKRAVRFVGRQAVSAFSDARQARADLRDYSPALRAADIEIPILLIHGDVDDVVPIEQSERMARALRRARKEHVFITLEGSGHDLLSQRDRSLFLEQLESFLGKHLGQHLGQADRGG